MLLDQQDLFLELTLVETKVVTSGLLVAVEVRVTTQHQPLVVVEVLHLQVFPHMLALDVVLISQIQELPVKMLYKILDPVEAELLLITLPMLLEQELVVLV